MQENIRKKVNANDFCFIPRKRFLKVFSFFSRNCSVFCGFSKELLRKRPINMHEVISMRLSIKYLKETQSTKCPFPDGRDKLVVSFIPKVKAKRFFFIHLKLLPQHIVNALCLPFCVYFIRTQDLFDEEEVIFDTYFGYFKLQ